MHKQSFNSVSLIKDITMMKSKNLFYHNDKDETVKNKKNPNKKQNYWLMRPYSTMCQIQNITNVINRNWKPQTINEKKENMNEWTYFLNE